MSWAHEVVGRLGGLVLGLGSVCKTGIGGCSSGVVSEVEKGLQALTRGSAGIVGAPHMGVNGRGLFLVLSDGRTGAGNGAREIPYEHKESFAVRAMGAVEWAAQRGGGLSLSGVAQDALQGCPPVRPGIGNLA